MAFSIDPKYFNKFVGTVGVLCLVAIFWGTMRYFQNQQTRFENELGDGREVRERSFYLSGTSDTVRVSQFAGSPVILNFWATWAQRSARVHEKLAEVQRDHPDVVVISVSVKDTEEYINSYIQEHDYDFIYADGTQAYQDLLVPGVPTQLVFDREGELIRTFVGFRNEDQFENLLLNVR